MKVTAGIGDLMSYEELCKQDVSEVFTGFIPKEYEEKYGNILPLNRREVLFYHTHLSTLSDMCILKRMEEAYEVPVVLTFNSLYYTKAAISDVLKIMEDLSEIGFTDYIIADFNLIRILSERQVHCNIHVSGEIGEWNTDTIRLLLSFSNDVTRIKRIIFHRKCTFSEMKKMISFGKAIDPTLEFEAFLLNEKCHYNGGFCFSLHSDEMVHLCQMPYIVSKEEKIQSEESDESDESEESEDFEKQDSFGASGCALCMISKLRDIGITHLKVVGRGQHISCIKRDVKIVNEALLLESKEEILEKVLQNSCSHNCYYEEEV